MSKSFYLTNSPTALYTGSNNFSTRISATPSAFGIDATQAAAYATLHDIYAAAFVAASEPATRTKPTIQARRDAALPLRQKAAELAKIINATPTVTNQQRLDLGLNVPKIPGPMPAPGTPYNARIQLDAHPEVQVR